MLWAPSWTDPRSGEIVSASVYLYHDVIGADQQLAFHTDLAGRSARAASRFLRRSSATPCGVLSHEIGHCLGFMQHGRIVRDPRGFAASPSFTRETGTTPSIMDYARFNYVAQPGVSSAACG